MSRKPLIAGNWKMNLNHLEAIAVVQKLAFTLPKDTYDRADVTVLPPFTDLRSVQTVIESEKYAITWGAQDVSVHNSGAYTGEISGAFLQKLGCTYVIVGHSERREYHQETSSVVAQKCAAALSHALIPIVCVGESLQVRENGEHREYVATQLRESLTGLKPEKYASIVIAYEPIWAIGTGKVATAEQAQEMCRELRTVIAQLTDSQIASGVRILYGGSVNAVNTAELISRLDIDGALVGGASLKPDEFARICALAAQLS